jgi:hypothetical protein
MEELEKLAAEIRELRATSKRPVFPDIIKQRALQFTGNISRAKINEVLEIEPSMLYKWKRQLLKKNNSNKFVKVAVKKESKIIGKIKTPTKFEVTINSIDLSFSTTPDSKWFAALIREMK